MPTGNYSHMDGEMEHMVDGDGGDDDGGDEAPRILPPGEKSQINLTPKSKIVVVAALCFVNRALLLGASVSRIYGGVRERPRWKRAPRLQRGEPARPRNLAAPYTPFWASGGPWAPSGAGSSCFPIKNTFGAGPIQKFLRKIWKLDFCQKQRQILQFLSKFEEIPERNIGQSAWKSRCIWGASAPPSLARCLSTNNSNVVKKR